MTLAQTQSAYRAMSANQAAIKVKRPELFAHELSDSYTVIKRPFTRPQTFGTFASMSLGLDACRKVSRIVGSASLIDAHGRILATHSHGSWSAPKRLS
jgi:hypothetical protein